MAVYSVLICIPLAGLHLGFFQGGGGGGGQNSRPGIPGEANSIC